jgi:hypothetical protein
MAVYSAKQQHSHQPDQKDRCHSATISGHCGPTRRANYFQLSTFKLGLRYVQLLCYQQAPSLVVCASSLIIQGHSSIRQLFKRL